jgi:hypothetical protein
VSFRIVFDHGKEREDHARSLVRHHLSEFEKENPRISGGGLARHARVCENCERVFWVSGSSYRYDCLACSPPATPKHVGFS